jgi:hypothetical protein
MSRLKRENTLRTTAVVSLFAALVVALVPSRILAQAQQTPIPEKPSIAPQIELDGTGIGTLEVRSPRFALPSGSRSSNTRFNLSDSAVLLGASERLFRRSAIGSFVIGAVSTESESAPSGTNLFLHQLYLDYQSRGTEAIIGRTNVATRLIDFPTLRGDDLNEFVNVLNPFSNGTNVEEHRYSNLASIVLNRNLRHFLNVHAQNLITSTPETVGQGGINSFGISFMYQGVPALEAIQKIPLWGVGFERQSIAKSSGGSSNLVYGGIVYNIDPDPVDRLDLRFQDIYSSGNNLSAFTGVTDTFRAANNTVAASLRWLHSPFGVPGHQLSLTVGYKTFNKVSNANTLGIAITGVKRLGDGFDLVAQYAYQHRNSAYAAVFNGVRDDHSVQVGFVFNFANTFNQHLGPRRSLLNLQHQYLPE